MIYRSTKTTAEKNAIKEDIENESKRNGCKKTE